MGVPPSHSTLTISVSYIVCFSQFDVFLLVFPALLKSVNWHNEGRHQTSNPASLNLTDLWLKPVSFHSSQESIHWKNGQWARFQTWLYTGKIKDRVITGLLPAWLKCTCKYWRTVLLRERRWDCNFQSAHHSLSRSEVDFVNREFVNTSENL